MVIYAYPQYLYLEYDIKSIALILFNLNPCERLKISPSVLGPMDNTSDSLIIFLSHIDLYPSIKRSDLIHDWSKSIHKIFSP